MAEELFDIVDGNNQPTGEKLPRSVVHAQGQWHRVVHIYVFREREGGLEFLVHLRSQAKDLGAGKWDGCFGGHLKSGETVEDAAVSELWDETGLSVTVSDLLAGFSWQHESPQNREFISVYYYRFDGGTDELTYHDGEVQEVRWMGAEDMRQAYQERFQEWVGSHEIFAQVYANLQQLLATHGSGR